MFDDVEGKGTKRTVLAVSLTQVQNDVHVETGPCAGSCASSPSEIRSPSFDEKLEFVSPEKPTAQDAVLSN